ncbi:MAG: Arm DNA-binding domain-containing protein, partial [Deltaproteobacteria bacterium]|nr:Arm DNA-binding domain-containing protein [Deltaproteobacteria bacterium]
MSLADVSIRNSHPKDKMYRISDGGNLYLEIYPNGSKLWRMRLKTAGRETMLSLGSYPTVSLKDARVKRDEINTQRANGIDPVAERKKASAKTKSSEITFLRVYDSWISERKPPFWSEEHYTKTKARIETYLLPILGKLPVAEIAPQQILILLKGIEKQNKITTAHTVRGLCSQIFRYA